MSGPVPEACLDLRGTPCPLNYVRSRLALERLPIGGWLQVDLDPGEPEEMVSESLSGDGHAVRRVEPGLPAGESGVRLLIQRGG
ncbi:MAG: sulfurtransferase TusA family protein [Cyanobacteriota bacterium]|jgi:TusA-related sulfurtransferase|nr:sulfurtransferase TusA family protein [Cyanobacteriota bacterium]